MNKKDFEHYQNQSDEADFALLKEEMIPFSVLASILQSPCTDIFTNHQSAIICHSSSPHPVWIWCKDVENRSDVDSIARCLKEAFPLESGYSYNIGYELLDRLQETDDYYKNITVSMGLLSYRLDEIQRINYPCGGGAGEAREEELETLCRIWHDSCLEMTGTEHTFEHCKERVRAHLENHTLFVWRDDVGEIAAITAKGRVGEYSKISGVYTLPDQRRKGYAINLVSHVAKTILDEGLIPILYTNADYPASNDCYKKIGFRQVGSLCTVRREIMDFTGLKCKLESLGYRVTCFDTAAEAAGYLDQQIDHKTVGFGGSVTLEQMKLYERLSRHNTVDWHQRIPEGMTSREVRMKANGAEIYVSSVNGLAETGEIINIDGNCNRVASIFYGHEKVYLIVGENKIAKDYDSALYRARNVASPLNAKRLGVKTPCAVKGDKCYNCNSPERLCRGLSVLWGPPMTGEFEVVLIHEKLGY
ncbi:MAG: GNAT family N-acetyltransferase [Lachnospiraceae bacterium]|nr:GNAT family N-acetyltransferase [Lachnospiraceae bacterium]